MKLGYILSLPRSGSTVLSAMLDRKKGVVSPPESSFPQVLGELPEREIRDPEWLAAVYFASTFVPSPLNFEEAKACMKGDFHEILASVGLAVAEKLGRERSEVRAVVWKSPRTINMQRATLKSGGKFIVIRRHPTNVFESQFRVGFGAKNRRPLRFAIFRESYEYAFSRIPAERLMEIEYDDLPGVLGNVLDFLGIEDRGEWLGGTSSLDAAASTVPHMRDVTKEFTNRDPEKRARLDSAQVQRLERAIKLARPLRGMLRPLRDHFDRESYLRVRRLAGEQLNLAK